MQNELHGSRKQANLGQGPPTFFTTQLYNFAANTQSVNRSVNWRVNRKCIHIGFSQEVAKGTE